MVLVFRNAITVRAMVLRSSAEIHTAIRSTTTPVPLAGAASRYGLNQCIKLTFEITSDPLQVRKSMLH